LKKITKFPITVRTTLDECIKMNCCARCIAKFLFIEYGIRIDSRTIINYKKRKNMIENSYGE